MEKPEEVILDSVITHGVSSAELKGRLIIGKWNGSDVAIFIYYNEADRDDLFLFLDHRLPYRSVALMSHLDDGLRMACEREGVLIWESSMVEALVGRHMLLSKAGVKLKDPLFPPHDEMVFEVFTADLDVRGEQTLVPRVSRAEVEHKGAKVGGFKFQLILVPHYLFKYRCRMHTTSGAEKDMQGLAWIDAVDGAYRDISPRFKAVDDIDQPHFKQEPDMPLAEATDMALQGIVEFNTRESEEVRHTGSATIFEKQRTYPLQDTIETELVGILFVPMWSVEGSRGTMTINGITAEVIREESYQAS